MINSGYWVGLASGIIATISIELLVTLLFSGKQGETKLKSDFIGYDEKGQDK